jgi:hypothetical protein
MEFEPLMLRTLGTHPLFLLSQFVDIGYDFKLLDYETRSLRPVTLNRLLEECKKNGRADLYLEKGGRLTRNQRRNH